MKAVTKKALKVHENAVKSAKKAVKASIIENPPSDRERLRNLTHQMLNKLETAIKMRKPKVAKKNFTDEQIEKLEKEAVAKLKENLEKLFGEKSYLDSLGSLSGLLLKLEQPTAPEMAADTIHSAELTMNEADLALVDGFVQRMRGDAI